MIVNIPIDIPVWVSWIAIDADGMTRVFEKKPSLKYLTDEFWSHEFDSRHIGICRVFNMTERDWTKELYQIIDGKLVK